MKKDKKLDKRTNSYMNIFHDFSEAMQTDQALYQLAAYDASNGMIMIPESLDQAMEFQKAVAKRFNYFKRLIQNSEMSFADIHKSIVGKNGPYPNKHHNLTTEQTIEQFINKPKSPDEIIGKDSVTNVLQKLFEDILHMSKQDVPRQDQYLRDDGYRISNNIFSNKTDTPIDSNPPNRVLPQPQPAQPAKLEDEGSEGSKPSKKKNVRTNKSTKTPKDKRNT